MGTTPSPAKSTIAAKILAVMGEIGELKKDKKNDHFNYQYASDELIVGAIRNALIKHNLAILPSQKSCVEIMTKTAKGEDQIITKLEMEFELLDAETNESKTKTFYGYGADKGDKGVYKAATGCEKYFLMKTFLIATPDDPEFERTQREARSAFSGRAQNTTTRQPVAPPATQTNGAPASPPAAPAPATAAPTNGSQAPVPRRIVNATLQDVSLVTPKNGGAKFYRLNGSEGESWITFSETVAKNAKTFAADGVPLAIAVDDYPRGPVVTGIKPA